MSIVVAMWRDPRVYRVPASDDVRCQERRVGLPRSVRVSSRIMLDSGYSLLCSQ